MGKCANAFLQTHIFAHSAVLSILCCWETCCFATAPHIMADVVYWNYFLPTVFALSYYYTEWIFWFNDV